MSWGGGNLYLDACFLLPSLPTPPTTRQEETTHSYPTEEDATPTPVENGAAAAGSDSPGTGPHAIPHWSPHHPHWSLCHLSLVPTPSSLVPMPSLTGPHATPLTGPHTIPHWSPHHPHWSPHHPSLVPIPRP